MMKGQIAGLMKQAQAMQENLKRARTSSPRSRSKGSRVPALSRSR